MEAAAPQRTERDWPRRCMSPLGFGLNLPNGNSLTRYPPERSVFQEYIHGMFASLYQPPPMSWVPQLRLPSSCLMKSVDGELPKAWPSIKIHRASKVVIPTGIRVLLPRRAK